MLKTHADRSRRPAAKRDTIALREARRAKAAAFLAARAAYTAVAGQR